MSFTNPEIKISGILFQNDHGSKYYSHYYQQHKTKELDINDPSTIKQFEHNLLQKVKRMNILATLRPEQSNPIHNLQLKSSPIVPSPSSSKSSMNSRSTWLWRRARISFWWKKLSMPWERCSSSSPKDPTQAKSSSITFKTLSWLWTKSSMRDTSSAWIPARSTIDCGWRK